MNKEEIKEGVIREYLIGQVSIRSLAKKYGYGISSIHRWLMAHKKNDHKEQLLIEAKLVSQENEVLPEDVKQLQEELRIMRIRLRLMEAMIDIADEQLGTQIRKKVGARQS